MFRPMRRFRQEMPREACEEILRTAPSGVLSLLDEDGYPYGVPMNHHYHDGKLYFHCAASGHKLDAARHHNKASFTVVARDVLVPEKLTTSYRSVIAFGEIHLIEDTEEKRAAVIALSEHLAPGISHAHESGGHLRNLVMMEMTVHHLSGKQSMDQVNK